VFEKPKGPMNEKKRSHDMEKVLPECREGIMFWGVGGAGSICVSCSIEAQSSVLS